MPELPQNPGHSFSIAQSLTCASCGREFEADLWLIVDAGQRRDLVERIRAGGLHELMCPHCGEAGQIDAPVLVYRSDAEPPLLFSPASQTSGEQDQEHAMQLAGALRQSLGDAWRDDWVAQRLHGVSRDALPALLSDDPETVLLELQQQAAAKMPPELRALLHELTAEGLDIRSPADLQRAMADRPDLHARLAAALQTHSSSLMPGAIRAAFDQAQQDNERYLTTGDQVALDAAVTAWERILNDPSFPTSEEQFRAVVRNGCGGSLLRRHLASGRGEDLNRALDLFHQAVAGTPPESAALPTFLNNLGAGLRERFQRTAHLEDLNEAIQVYRKAVACVPPDSPELPHYLNNLGIALSDRHGRVGRIQDIEEAIRVWRQAVAATPPRSPDLPATLTNLGNGLSYRYGCTGRLEDLDEAVQACEQAVTATLPASPQLPSHLCNLGNRLSDRYKRTGGLKDLEQAIHVYRHAVERAPSDSRHLPVYLWALGIRLSDRYERTARVEDLHAAINAWEQAVARTPRDSPEFASHLNSLGIGLFHRYMLTERFEDLEEAIRMWRQAISLTRDSPELSLFFNGLGTGLCYRHLHTGRLEDLEEAIRSWREAVERTPPDSPDLPSRLSNLGNGLGDRYRRMGRLKDLEEAMRVYQRAVKLTPPESPELPSNLNNLGNGLLHLGYYRTGRLDELEEAIRVYRRAVELTPPKSPELPTRLSNLGNGLHIRYQRSGRLGDLEEAICVYRRAVERTPPNSVELPSHLNGLSIGLSDRYRHTGRLEDLEEAIQAWQHVVERTPAGSPLLPTRLNNLGRGLSDRYMNTGRLEDLEEAIQTYRQAIEQSSPDSPGLARSLANMGNLMSERYSRTGRLDDLEEGRSAYQRAGEVGSVVDPEAAIVSGRSWVHWAFGRAAWQETATAFQGVLAVLDRLLREQVLRSGKESWLREAQGVAALGAYALAREGRAEQAVIALEQGRVRLLAEALEHTRRDLERLPQQGHLDAYRRFRDAAETVRTLQLPMQEGDTPPRFDRHQAIQMARVDLDAAISAIRAIAGFEDFLVAPDWDSIQRTVTPDAPLVYLVTTSAGSLALIVQQRENGTGSHPDIAPVWLDEFCEADLDELLIERSDDRVTGGYLPGQLGRIDWLQASLDRLLPRLGEKLMGPLAERLRVNGDGSPRLASGNAGERANQIPSGVRDLPGVQDLPRIVLIPTGRLSLPPLHAARYEVGPDGSAGLGTGDDSKTGKQVPSGVRDPLGGHQICFADEFTVSYAISGTVLAKARQEARARSGAELRLVGVGNPLPESPEAAEARPGSLPFARAELESIADMLPSGAARTFYEHHATRQTLLDALPNASLIHLSCHGRFRADNPLESGLLLADGELTLRDIIAAGFSALAAARPVVLSACQTAIQDFNNLPDEAIGLPGGLTQPGVPSVVGTLWSVSDASTALLMVRFYELLLQDKLAPPEALRRAQCWLREVTNADLDAYLSYHEALALARQQQAERMPLSAVHTLLGPVLKGDPNERPYAHPYYWAPFVFYGAEQRIFRTPESNVSNATP